MFLRSINRQKDGKAHRYFSVVENRRLVGSKTAQRTVLYLGEINDQQQAAWRKTLNVFDEEDECYKTMSLFPHDREIPADVLDSVQVKLSGLEWRRPRVFGNCWLGCEVWNQLGLDEFWQQRLPEGPKEQRLHDTPPVSAVREGLTPLTAWHRAVCFSTTLKHSEKYTIQSLLAGLCWSVPLGCWETTG